MKNPLCLLGIAAASGSLILTGCGSSSEANEVAVDRAAATSRP